MAGISIEKVNMPLLLALSVTIGGGTLCYKLGRWMAGQDAPQETADVQALREKVAEFELDARIDYRLAIAMENFRTELTAQIAPLTRFLEERKQSESDNWTKSDMDAFLQWCRTHPQQIETVPGATFFKAVAREKGE